MHSRKYNNRNISGIIGLYSLEQWIHPVNISREIDTKEQRYGKDAKKGYIPIIHTFDNYQITWQSREDVSTVNAKRSGWKKIFASGRLNLRRGYPEKALFRDDVAPVDHIISVVTEILNKVYRLYVMYNPRFEEVKFSIVGHSLDCTYKNRFYNESSRHCLASGAVIAYDVIKPWSIIRLYERHYDEVVENASKSKLIADRTRKKIEISRQCRTELKKEVKSLTRLFMLSPGETVQLIFNVHNLYCLGSPLGAFLDTRGIRGRKLIPENLHRLFNIFFGADIIAYRLEPLLSTVFTRIEPLKIHSYGVINQQAYESMPVIEILSKKPAAKTKSVEEKTITENQDAGVLLEHKISRSIMVNLKTNKLPYRLDYVLPMSYFDMTNICKFHSAYWKNYDLIMFILYHSYGSPKSRKSKNIK
uniref:DDHD domain-containing protein n=1 Tax=Romanomermis culicivorax TaxID=13658 RepID=A0A915K9N1_ROMCU